VRAGSGRDGGKLLEGTLNKGVKHVVEVISTNENRRDSNPLPVVGLSPSSVVNPLPDPAQGSGEPVAELSDAEVDVLARALLGAVRKKFADPKFVARYEKSRAKGTQGNA
jgi:hypothetical protein